MKKLLSILLCVITVFMLQTQVVFADYENTYENTGDYIEDLISIALTQIGYTTDGKSKYGDNSDWNVDFIQWCAGQAKIPTNIIPNQESAAKLYDFYSENLRLNVNPEYIPEKGDIMFLGNDTEIVSCALVVSNDSQFITAIIGNEDNCVKKKLYTLGMDKIIGFAKPDYDFVSNYTVGKHMTTASFLNMRSEPNTNCTILAKIPVATIVDIQKFDGDWGYINYDGKNGWISMDYAVLYDDSYSDNSKYAVNWNVIDVSKWQGTIDWNKVASSNIEAVIIRIGVRYSVSRVIEIDEKFLDYYNGAKDVGLHIGCYFYSTAITDDEAIEEAEFVIDTINKYDLQFDMPVFMDMEDSVIQKCGKTAIFNMTHSFLHRMEEENIYSGVYCSTSWATDYYTPSLFTNHPLWIADWHDKCNYDGNYDMWQYTDKGSISGIAANYTDLSICYVDFPSLISDNGYNKKPVINTEYKKGDINNDDKVTATDARLALRISAKLDEPTELQKKAADVNNDSKVTATDARIILRVSAKLEKL